MRNKKSKKGFTLVELLVVIAILAVLATVSVVGYMSFTKKAQVSNDESLVAQLNIALKADEATDGKPSTPTEMLEVMEENGFKVENLTPTTSKYNIVWNQEDNQFVLLDENDGVVYGTLSTKEYMNWKFADSYTTASTYSIYLKGTSVTSIPSTIHTGLDVGNNKIETITYEGEGEAKENLVIRTNSFDTTLNVTAYENGEQGNSNYTSDTMKHYGYAKEVNVNKAGFSSYHEFGKVAFLTLHEGKLVAEEESNVVATYIPDSSKSYDIAINGNGILKDVYANKPSDATTANEKINDSKVEVKALTNDEDASEGTVTTIIAEKKEDAKNEALDSEVNNGGIKVEGSYRVGDKGYDSFEDALVAAKANKATLALQTQTLYENEETPLVNEGETLTLDLNGYTWRPSTKWYTIQNKGTLTIKDSSTNNEGKVTSWTSGETGSSLIDNWGNLTIESGNFYSNGSTVVKNEPNATLEINDGNFELNKEMSNGYFYNAILNYGTATINDGDFSANGGAAVWNQTANGSEKTTTIEINGGTFVSTAEESGLLPEIGALHNKDAEMCINGGTFKGYSTAIYNVFSSSKTKLVINNGDFSYDENSFRHYTLFDSNYQGGSTTINGGMFRGTDSIFDENVGGFVYGGTFERDLTGKGYVASGYKTIDNGDGTWTVTKA